MRPLVLASSSPYRRELLERLGIAYASFAPAIDEAAHPGETAQQLVARLARQKARAGAQRFNRHLIIGSDQVATLDGDILTKPGDHQRASEQLQRCAGRAVTFFTGLCLYDSERDEDTTIVEPFTVHFRPLTDSDIQRYLQREQPYDCAGSFKMEGLGITLFEKLSGDDPNALIGLPLIRLVDLLKKAGLSIP